MRVAVLRTNHGPHPADKWALVTAQHIMPVDPDTVGDRMLAAQRLQLAVADKLVIHHTNVQNEEREHLQTAGDARLEEPLDAETHVSAAYADIVEAAKGSFWEAHVQKPEVADLMKAVLHNHFTTSQDIERSWHKTRSSRA